MYEEDDYKIALEELKPSNISPFINFYCDECSSSLEDRGDEPLIFGDCDDDNFPELILCGKCAADFLGEEDYHSEQLANNEISFVELNFNEGMKKTTCDVIKSLALGMTEKEILEKLPHLNHKDILACYEFAAQRL